MHNFGRYIVIPSNRRIGGTIERVVFSNVSSPTFDDTPKYTTTDLSYLTMDTGTTALEQRTALSELRNRLAEIQSEENIAIAEQDAQRALAAEETAQAQIQAGVDMQKSRDTTNIARSEDINKQWEYDATGVAVRDVQVTKRDLSGLYALQEETQKAVSAAAQLFGEGGMMDNVMTILKWAGIVIAILVIIAGILYGLCSAGKIPADNFICELFGEFEDATRKKKQDYEKNISQKSSSTQKKKKKKKRKGGEESFNGFMSIEYNDNSGLIGGLY